MALQYGYHRRGGSVPRRETRLPIGPAEAIFTGRERIIDKPLFIATKEPIKWSNIYQVTNLVRDEINASPKKYSAIARDINMSPGTISRLADGTTREPRMSTVVRILNYFGYEIYSQKVKQ